MVHPLDPTLERRRADPTRSAMAVALFAMASLIETRDSDSDKHILRVQNYLRVLAQRLSTHPRLMARLTEDYMNDLIRFAPLYDMGTIGIPDRILLKPGRLTPREYEIMQTHTTLAYEAIVRAEQTLGLHAEQLQLLKELVHCHQEKWDGSGYPRGLVGNAIPLSARLLAIADVYDALISDKVYKSGVSHDKAAGIIFQGRESHFDPDVVDAFMDIQDQFESIAQEHADTAQDMQHKIDYLANAIAEDAEM
jgi:putative two-component system response regulator